MSARSPKRRKTSSTAATPTFNQDMERVSSARASYMSPTRASLSRFNPTLLPGPSRRRSAMTPRKDLVAPIMAPQADVATDHFLQRGANAFDYIMGNFKDQLNTQMQQAFATVIAGTNSPNPFVNPAALSVEPTGLETDEQMAAMREAIRQRKQHENRRVSESALGTPDVMPKPGRMVSSEAAVETPEAREALPATDDDDELSAGRPRAVSMTKRAASIRSSAEPRSIFRSRNRQASIPAVEPADEVDEISPDAPKPDARRRRLPTVDDGLPETPEHVRRQMEAQDHPPRGVLFSSPSKRKAAQLRGQMKAAPVRVPSPAAAPQATVVADQADLSQQPSAERPVRVLDKEGQAKDEEKTAVEAELQYLEDDVRELRRFTEVYGNETADLPTDIGDVLKLLESSRRQKSAHAEPSLSSMLTSFLPFSGPPSKLPTATASLSEEPGFCSHEPLQEDDPLPLNTLFTPLSLASTTYLPLPVPGSADLIQKHSLRLSSPGSMLTCSLELDILSSPNDVTPAVKNLKMTGLSPWASAEIGTWIKEQSQQGDTSAIGYALGRYWEVSVRRARYWIQCMKAFPQLFPDVDLDLADDGGDAEEMTMPRKLLAPYLGKQTLVFRSAQAVLRVHWRISMDWTGEVESRLSAKAVVPKRWKDVDKKGILGAIPAVFHGLVMERGVMEAVKFVGGLLFEKP